MTETGKSSKRDRHIQFAITEDISEIPPAADQMNNSGASKDNLESTAMEDTTQSQLKDDLEETTKQLRQANKQLIDEQSEALEYRVENIALRKQINELQEQITSMKKEADEKEHQSKLDQTENLTLKEKVQNQSERIDELSNHIEVLQINNSGGGELVNSDILYQGLLNQFHQIKRMITRSSLKSPEEVAELDADEICNLLKGNELKSDLKELNKFILKVSEAKAKMNDQSQADHLEKVIKELLQLADSFDDTTEELKRVAKERNIKYGNLDRASSLMHGVSKPSFDGNQCTTNIYQFLRSIKSYCQFHNILHEDSGWLIKECLEGEARTAFDQNFHTNANPDPDEVARILKSHYGDRQVILNQIKAEHVHTGLVRDHLEPSEYEDTFRKISKHLLLLQNAKMLLDEQDPAGEPISFKSYVAKLSTVIPVACMERYRNGSQHLSRQSDKFRHLENCVSNYKNFIFELLQNERADNPSMFQKSKNSTPDNSRSFMTTESRPQNLTFKMEQIELDDCKLCSYMSAVFNIYPSVKDHLVCRDRPGYNLTVSQDYCPHVIKLTLEEKSMFYDQFDICKTCLLQPISRRHYQDECNYTTKFPRSKCADPHCNLRFVSCASHKNLNLHKLEERRNLNIASGLKLNY